MKRNIIFKTGDKVITIDEIGVPKQLYFIADLNDLKEKKPSGYNYLLTFKKELAINADLLKIINENIDYFGDGNDYKMEYSLEYYYSFNEFKFSRIQKRYKWFKKRNTRFYKWYNRSKFFSPNNTNISDTKLFEYFRKNKPLLRSNYYIKMFLYHIKHLSKLFVYPIIFIGASISTSYKSFIDLKIAKNKYDQAEYTFKLVNYAGNAPEKTRESLDIAKKEYDKSETHFLESGKFISTIIISLITLLISLIINIRIIDNKENEIAALEFENIILIDNNKKNIEEINSILEQKKIHEEENNIEKIQYENNINRLELQILNKDNTIGILENRIDMLNLKNITSN